MTQKHGNDRTDGDEQQLRDARMLRELYARGKLSRRAFLRSAAALGGAAFLAACGGAPATQQGQVTAGPGATAAPAPATTESPAAAPMATEAPPAAATDAPAQPAAGGQARVGGTYRIHSASDIRSLDPPAAEGSEDWWSAGMILYNMLYFFDKDGKFYADLAAAEPEISSDGLTYTIPLRTGVKFHNGREMVADDVKFTLERQLWPEVYSWGKTYMDNVVGYQDVIDGKTKELAGVTVDGPYTVVIKLTKPQAVFPFILAMSMNAIIPQQETLDAGADWGVKTVIGTGPYKFVEWVQGQRAVYERNPDYFKAGLPYLERIELNLNVEDSVQMLRWESGEAELIRAIPAAERERVLSDPEISQQVRRGPATSVSRLGIQHQVKPFDDPRVRQAVAMAVDKATLAQAAGAVVPPLEGFYAIPMLQYDENFKSRYQYDPEGAKALLAEAGHPDGLKGVVLMATWEVGELLLADLQAAGIEAELAPAGIEDTREFVRSGQAGLFLYSWSASFPDAFDYVSAWTSCAAAETGYNDGFYCNKRIDELLGQAEALPQPDPRRTAAYREIEDLVINQDIGFVGLYNGQGLVLGSAKVRDDDLSPIYQNWPYLEYAWMEG